MNATVARRRLIVNADDFGKSATINQAVIQAHRRGILTTASLMVNEGACEEAVSLARQHPKLGVGLHLSLLCGRSGLTAHQIPKLANEKNAFTNSPFNAGMRYFFSPGIREQLRREIHEQFRRFHETGLVLDHLNGHLHMHLHPTVLSILLSDAGTLGITRMRLTSDPLGLDYQISGGSWGYRLSHAVIFGALANRARPRMKASGIQHTNRVFGLLRNSRVDEEYVLRLVDRLPAGDSELYSHPSLDEFKHEFDALVSPRVRARVEDLGIELARYQDL